MVRWVVMLVCVGVAAPVRAERLAWHLDALAAWYPETPSLRPGGDPMEAMGGHVVAALRGGYYHGLDRLIVGVEGYVGYGFPIFDEDATQPVELEPRIGLRMTRVRHDELTFDTWETIKGSCRTSGGGGYLIETCMQRLTDRSSFRSRAQKEYAVLLGLRVQPDGRMAGTLAYRWQLARRYEEKLSGNSPIPSPIAFVFDAGASAVLQTTDNFETVAATNGVGGYFDVALMVGSDVAWTVGTRLGFTGFQYTESDEPEYLVWLYVGRGGMAGR